MSGRRAAVRKRRGPSQAARSCRSIVGLLEPTMAQEKLGAIAVLLPASTLRLVYEAALRGYP